MCREACRVIELSSDSERIDGAGSLGDNHALGKIARDGGPIARGRVAVTLGAGRDDLHPLSGLKHAGAMVERCNAGAVDEVGAAALAPPKRPQEEDRLWEMSKRRWQSASAR